MLTKRSVLTFLAGLPVVGLFVPKLAQVEILPEEIYPEPTDTDLKKVFDEIRAFVKEHPGAIVSSADEPQWQFLGWAAYKQYGAKPDSYEVSRHWTISLHSFKQGGLDRFPYFQQEMVKMALRTLKGRENICSALMKPPV